MTRTAPARANAAWLLARLLADRADDAGDFHAEHPLANRDRKMQTP
jgi:hypothetical protein